MQHSSFTTCLVKVSLKGHSMALANLKKSEEVVKIPPQHQSTYLHCGKNCDKRIKISTVGGENVSRLIGKFKILVLL